MNLFNLEQYRMVLEVLEQMKDCVDRNDNYTTVKGKPFNLNRQAGICWHVFVHTPCGDTTGIYMDYLSPVFIEMGLHADYPVEALSTDSKEQMRKAFSSQTNMYDDNTIHGARRINLLNELIQYFSEKLKMPVTETMYTYYYELALLEMNWFDTAEEAVSEVLDYGMNRIWPALAALIVQEDPSLGEVLKDTNYSDTTLETIVTANLQKRIAEALEKL